MTYLVEIKSCVDVFEMIDEEEYVRGLHLAASIYPPASAGRVEASGAEEVSNPVLYGGALGSVSQEGNFIDAHASPQVRDDTASLRYCVG